MDTRYIPHGFTMAEVREAAQSLPDPARHRHATGNRTVKVAVHEYPNAAYSAPNSEWLRANSECNSYMRILTFDLLSNLDYKTDRIVYAWVLVGGNQ